MGRVRGENKRMPYKRPAYPVELTKANWDKNKGLLAKMAGFTGIGDSLTTLKAAYDKVGWDKIELPWVNNRPSQAEFTLAKLDAMVKIAVAEMNGSAANLRTAALATRDLAKKTEADFKKNKAIPSASTKLCATIGTSAEHLASAVNTNSLSGFIKNDSDLVRQPYDVTFNALMNKLPSFVSALESAVKAQPDPPTTKSWTDAGMMTLCRNLNQNIGNVEKLTEKGYATGIDINASKAFFNEMQVFAAKGCPFDTPEEASKAKSKVISLVATAKNIK